MRSPTPALLTQSVTVFTPVKATEPVNGGYATTYTKTVYRNVRYTLIRYCMLCCMMCLLM